jgi:Spy/CpxP family protein refolding chaperone
VSPRARAGALLAAVFVLGALCGAFATAAWTVHKIRTTPIDTHAAKTMFVRQLARKLDLDARQRAELEGIAERGRGDLVEVRARTLAEIRAVLARGEQELRPLLDERQRSALDAVREELEARLTPAAAP